MNTKNLFDLEPEDLLKLNKKELKEILKQTSKVNNSRIKRLKQSAPSSPALRQYERGGSKPFKANNKMSLNQLRQEYKRQKIFYESKTSTVSGAKSWIDNSIQGLEKEGITISEETFDNLWKTYEKLKEIDPSITAFKYNVIAEIQAQLETDNDAESAIQNMQDRLSEIYEESIDTMGEEFDLWEILEENDDGWEDFF